MKKHALYFPKNIIASIFAVFIIKILCLVMMISGQVCTDYNGFSVDREENLYVGKPSQIEVYSSDGSFLRSFSSQTSRGYHFTIKDGETVLVDTGAQLHILDLQGNVLSVIDGDYSGVNFSKKFISQNGNQYQVNRILRTSVVLIDGDQKKTVFEMPLLDYMIKLLESFSDIAGVVIAVVAVVKMRGTIKARSSN